MWLWGNDVSSFWGRVPNRTLRMWFTLLFKFNVSSFSMAGDILNLKLLILLKLSSSKLIVILLTLDKSELILLVCFYWLWAVHSYFTVFGQDNRLQKTITTLSIWQKILKPCIGSGTCHFQWFDQQKSWTGWVPQLTSKIQRLNLLFLSVACFSDLRENISIMTPEVLHITEEISF